MSRDVTLRVHPGYSADWRNDVPCLPPRAAPWFPNSVGSVGCGVTEYVAANTEFTTVDSSFRTAPGGKCQNGKGGSSLRSYRPHSLLMIVR